MMGFMEKVAFNKSLTLRASDAAHRAISDTTQRVRWLPELSFRGGRVTQEAVINATWLWLSDRSDEELVTILGEYLPRLEAAMAGDGEPAGEAPARTGPRPQPANDLESTQSKVERDERKQGKK